MTWQAVEITRMIKSSSAWSEEREAFYLALNFLFERAEYQHKKEIKQRALGFARMTTMQATEWIAWVRKNAEKLSWCGELVATVVAIQLTPEIMK